MPYTAAELRAVALDSALREEFPLPDVDLTAGSYLLPPREGNPFYDQITRLKTEDLSEGGVNGSGIFEKLMASLRAHLTLEYDKGRITGDQFTKAYIELTSLAMQTGLQFLMSKELNFWQAMLAKEQGKRAEIEAVTAAIALETSKAQLALITQQAKAAEVQVVLTKMQVATQDAAYETAWKQIALLLEQIEVQHAQHQDLTTTGAAVTGLIQRQRELLEEQRRAFIRDADAKIAKMYMDSWITQKTIDEGLSPPDQFVNFQVNDVMVWMRERAGSAVTPTPEPEPVVP
jgi:hypothetical protein